MSPMEGSTMIYRKLVVPFFNKNHATIDNIIAKGKDKVNKIADEVMDQGIPNAMLMVYIKSLKDKYLYNSI